MYMEISCITGALIMIIYGVGRWEIYILFIFHAYQLSKSDYVKSEEVYPQVLCRFLVKDALEK